MSSTFTINVINSVSTGSASGYFMLPGDFTAIFFPGFQFSLKTTLETIEYTTASSTLVGGQTQVNVNSAVFGSIVAIGNLTPGTGLFVTGTYAPVPTNGGSGGGAALSVSVTGPGPIYTTNSLVSGTNYTPGTYINVPLTIVGGPILTNAVGGGSGYVDGTYANVPLTGGSGSGAAATLVVSGGAVTGFTFTNTGIGYAVGDVLSASNANLGGTGSGFSTLVQTIESSGSGAQATFQIYNGGVQNITVTTPGSGYVVGNTLSADSANLGGTGSGFSVNVASVRGTLTSASIVQAGTGYQQGDVLSFSGTTFGTNNTVTVTAATTNELGTITINSNIPKFKVGESVWVINNHPNNCSAPWWQSSSFVNTPAIQSGLVLAVTVSYMDSSNSPKITYAVRLVNQTGVVNFDESAVYVDKASAVAAYSALQL